MMIFDTSIMKWRKQTQADKDWAAAVVKAAFPELMKGEKQI